MKTLVTLDRWWLPVEIRSLRSSSVTNTDSCRCTESPPPPPQLPDWHRVSRLFHQCPVRGGWCQFFNPNARYHLQSWRGSTASRWLLLFGPLDIVATGSEAFGRHANQKLCATAPSSEQAWNDGWWHSVKLPNKLGCGPNAAKTVKVQGSRKSVSSLCCDSPAASVAVMTPSVYQFNMLMYSSPAPYWYFS